MKLRQQCEKKFWSIIKFI